MKQIDIRECGLLCSPEGEINPDYHLLAPLLSTTRGLFALAPRFRAMHRWCRCGALVEPMFYPPPSKKPTVPPNFCNQCGKRFIDVEEDFFSGPRQNRGLDGMILWQEFMAHPLRYSMEFCLLDSV